MTRSAYKIASQQFETIFLLPYEENGKKVFLVLLKMRNIVGKKPSLNRKNGISILSSFKWKHKRSEPKNEIQFYFHQTYY